MMIESTIKGDLGSIDLNIIVRYLISWWRYAQTRRQFFIRHCWCGSFFILYADVLAIGGPNRPQFPVISLRLDLCLRLWNRCISRNEFIITTRFILNKLAWLMAVTIVYAICEHICFIIILMVNLAWDFKRLSFGFLGNICTLYTFFMFCEIKLRLHKQWIACQGVFLNWFIYVWLYIKIHLLLIRVMQETRGLLLYRCGCKIIQDACGPDIIHECCLLNSQFWGRLIFYHHWRQVITIVQWRMRCWIGRRHFLSIGRQLLLMKHPLAIQRSSEYFLSMDILKFCILI